MRFAVLLLIGSSLLSAQNSFNPAGSTPQIFSNTVDAWFEPVVATDPSGACTVYAMKYQQVISLASGNMFTCGPSGVWQAVSSSSSSFAALSGAIAITQFPTGATVNQLPYFNGAAWVLGQLGASQITGLGSAALVSTSTFDASGAASAVLATSVQKANNGSDFANASTTRTNLGVAIGSNVEAWSAALDTFATMTPANVILSSGTYSNPSWLTAVANAKVTGLGSAALQASSFFVQPASSNTYSGSTLQDFGAAGFRPPYGTLAAIPGTCSVWQLYIATDQQAGANIYECAVANTWSAVGASASTANLAVVRDPSGDIATNHHIFGASNSVGVSSAWLANSYNASTNAYVGSTSVGPMDGASAGFIRWPANKYASQPILQDGAGTYYLDSGGSSNTITLNVAYPEYTDNSNLCFKVAYPITGAVTLFSIDNAATTKTLQMPGGVSMASADAPAGTILCAAYNTTSAVWNVTSITPKVAYQNRVNTYASQQIMNNGWETGVATNTDQAGSITLAAGAGSYTFLNTGYTHAPICSMFDFSSQGTAVTFTETVLALTITGTGTHQIYYQCTPRN